MNIPSKETIEYGRRAIEAEVERLKGFTKQAQDAGRRDEASRWDKLRWHIERRFLGQGGCVIAPFDVRWLDDSFRTIMEQVHD